MGINFSAVKTGSMFTTIDGETFKKTSELTYDDMAGIERYIDPFFDKKIGPPVETSPKPDVDTSAHVIQGDEPQPKKAKKSKKGKSL